MYIVYPVSLEQIAIDLGIDGIPLVDSPTDMRIAPEDAAARRLADEYPHRVCWADSMLWLLSVDAHDAAIAALPVVDPDSYSGSETLWVTELLGVQ